MSKIASVKYNALKDIVNSYQKYDGKSQLENQIEKLKDKIPDNEYKALCKVYDTYLDYILVIFSRTRKVYVKLDKNSKQEDLELEDNFAEFEDLE